MNTNINNLKIFYHILNLVIKSNFRFVFEQFLTILFLSKKRANANLESASNAEYLPFHRSAIFYFAAACKRRVRALINL